MKKILLLLVTLFALFFTNTVSAAVFVVSSTSDVDNGLAYNTPSTAENTLRKCIRLATTTAGPNTINFNIGGIAPYIITMGTAYNALNGQNVTIDATTQPSWTAAQPVVIIRGNTGLVGFSATGNTHTIKGLIFQSLRAGIQLTGGSNHTVQGCWFGVDYAGTSEAGVSINEQGVYINNVQGSTIGGTAAGERNIISGCLNANGTGRLGAIHLSGGSNGTTIRGNYIGTNALGTAAIGNGNNEPLNQHGIYLDNSSTAGSPVVIDQNVISGNIGNGILANGGCSAIRITGNKIGTDAAGMARVPNKAGGIRLDGGSAHTIGGNTAAARNIISANGGATDSRPCRGDYCGAPSGAAEVYDGTLQCGIYFNAVTSSTISGNYIGVNATGLDTLGNLYAGIKLENNSDFNTIGGIDATYRNVIGGNGFDYLTVTSPVTNYFGHGIQLNLGNVNNTTIRNNYIGIGPDGSTAVGNRQDGISILGSKDNTIQSNLIGNNAWGIFLQNDFQSTGSGSQPSGNIIISNLIGTDATGLVAVGNGVRAIDFEGGGVGIQHGSYSNIVGTPTGRNIVSGNRQGVAFRNSSNGGPVNNNIVQNNYIGLGINGTTVVPNTLSGVTFVTRNVTAVYTNTIGGVNANESNYIAGNGTHGIEIDSSRGAKILNNFIGLDIAMAAKGNGGDGINLHNGARYNIIGGTAAEGNDIAYNSANGIQITNPNAAGAFANAIHRNSIYCNGLRGIELNGAGNNNYAAPTFTGTPTNFSVTGGAWIELYTLDGCNSCPGGSTKLQGRTLVAEGAPGSASVTNVNPATYGMTSNLDFTATTSSAAPSTTNGATTAHNTSEFSVCQVLCVPTTAPASVTVDRNDFCTDDAGNITLEAIGGSGTSVGWYTGSCGGTPIGTGTSLTIASPTVSTTYYARWEASGCTPSSCASVAVNVNTPPTDPATASVNRNDFCSSDAGDITLTATGGSGGTLNWYSGSCGGTSVGTGTPLTIASPSASTTYYARWETTGCVASLCASVAVNVNAQPLDPASATVDRNDFCTNDAGNITLTATGGSGATLNWYSGSCGGTSVGTGTPLTIASPTANTTYYARWETTSCTPSLCASVTVNVNDLPTTSTIAGPISVCPNQTSVVYFVTGNSGSTFAWTVPSGATFSGDGTNTITVDFGITGGDITVIETTTAGCSNPSPITLTISTDPAGFASVTPTTAAICPGDNTTLTAGPTGATYRWFESGTFTGQTTESISVSAAGNYTVEVSQATCKDTSDAAVVTIKSIPATPTVGSNSPVCTGDDINLTADEPSATSYSWTGPNGFASTDQNPTISNATTLMDGTYSVTAIAAGCSSAVAGTVDVQINEKPVTPTAGSNSPVCTGNDINLTASVAGATSYSWTGPDGFTSATQNPTLSNATALMEGTYSVIGIAAGCSSTVAGTVDVTVNPRPNTPLITGPVNVCEGSANVNFSADPVISGATYTWTSPPGSTITGSGNAVTISFPTGAGNGDVTVFATVGGCEDLSPSTATITVNPGLTVSIAADGPTTFCQDGDVVLSGVISGGSPTATYDTIWVFDQFSQASETLTVTAQGSYTINIISSEPACGTADATQVVTVNPKPTAAVAGVDRTICGTSLQLNANHPLVGQGTWTVVLGEGTGTFVYPDSNKTVVTGLSTGINRFVWTITGNCLPSSSDTVEVDADNLSTVVVVATASQDSFCLGGTVDITADVTGTTATPYTFTWTSSDGSLNFVDVDSNSSTVTVTPTVTGWVHYYIDIMDANGCTGNPSGADSVYMIGQQALVVPNLITPNADHHNDCLIIRDADQFDILPGSEFQLYNRWGQAVYQNNEYKNGDFCGGDLSDGMYYYYIKTGCGENEIKGWLHIISNEASNK